MGSIIKLIVMILVVLFVVRLVKRLFSAGVSTEDNQRAIDLKPCAYCGTHVYEKQAVIKKGQVFCSAEHMNKFS